MVLVESHEIWDWIAALAYQLGVTLICHLVLWGLSLFTCKVGELVDLIYSQNIWAIRITTGALLKGPYLRPINRNSGEGKR